MAQVDQQGEKAVDTSSIPSYAHSIFEDCPLELQKPELSLEEPVVTYIFLTMGNKKSSDLEQELLMEAASCRLMPHGGLRVRGQARTHVQASGLRWLGFCRNRGGGFSV